MSGISETTIRERLQKITNTAQSIQTLSIWILHHQKKHADLILDIWLKEVRNNTDNERLINLIYLANDVIQNARKKAPSFMNAFYEVLQPAVSHITNTVDSSHRKKLERILDVWRERQIYKNEQLDVLYQALAESSISSPTNLNSDPESPTNYRGSPSSSSHGKRPNSPITSPKTAKKIKEEIQAFSGLNHSMVTILRRLEDPASADVKIRQLIAGYPENIANPSLLKQIKSREEVDALENKICEAIPIVDQYCNRLKEELKDRHNLQYQMMDYAKALEQANERNKELVDSMRKRIARLDAEKKEMAKHIESLPDLSEIAGTTTLPPLGELFTSTR